MGCFPRLKHLVKSGEEHAEQLTSHLSLSLLRCSRIPDLALEAAALSLPRGKGTIHQPSLLLSTIIKSHLLHLYKMCMPLLPTYDAQALLTWLPRELLGSPFLSAFSYPSSPQRVSARTQSPLCPPEQRTGSLQRPSGSLGLGDRSPHSTHQTVLSPLQ